MVSLQRKASDYGRRIKGTVAVKANNGSQGRYSERQKEANEVFHFGFAASLAGLRKIVDDFFGDDYILGG